MDVTIPNQATIGSFLLALTRVSGLLFASPVLGNRNIPMTAKVFLALLITMLCLPLIPQSGLSPDSNGFIPAMVSEVLLGGFLGLVGTVLFAVAEFSGQVSGTQMGFAIANILSPESEHQVSVFASLVSLIAILVFVLSDAHHLFVAALVKSFRSMPPGTFVVKAAHADSLVRMTTHMFVYGLALSAPVLCATTFVTVALGILSRSMPQIDVFFMGFGINIAVGFLVFIASIPFTLALIQRLIGLLDQEMLLLLGAG